MEHESKDTLEYKLWTWIERKCGFSKILVSNLWEMKQDDGGKLRVPYRIWIRVGDMFGFTTRFTDYLIDAMIPIVKRPHFHTDILFDCKKRKKKNGSRTRR